MPDTRAQHHALYVELVEGLRFLALGDANRFCNEQEYRHCQDGENNYDLEGEFYERHSSFTPLFL